jgi:LexA-binding, inner membrane-associated putative hydrolase
MPTPLGHALGGLLVGLILPDRTHPQPRRNPLTRRAAVYAVAACLPDIDFLWGRHNMETHSLGFACAVGLLVLVWKRDVFLAIGATLAVCTHVLFDWLGSDDFPPLGVMALWPLTSRFYFADAFVFEAISRRYWLPGFVMHNLLAVLREVAILGPVVAAVWWFRRREGRSRGVLIPDS